MKEHAIRLALMGVLLLHALHGTALVGEIWRSPLLENTPVLVEKSLIPGAEGPADEGPPPGVDGLGLAVVEVADGGAQGIEALLEAAVEALADLFADVVGGDDRLDVG